MELRVLGSIEIYNGHRLAIGGPRQRRIVAVLAAHAGEVVSVDRLVDIAWAGEPAPEQAVRNLRTNIHRIRQALGDELADRIATEPPGYVLHAQANEIDAELFDLMSGEAAQLRVVGDPQGALGHVEQALALWHGQPYAEFADEDWARAEVVRLEEARAGALELKCQLLLDLDRVPEALAQVDSLIERYPLREGPRALHMTALYRSGRQAEALRAFQEFREFLVDEAGLSPSAELTELDRAVARGDLADAADAERVRAYELHELIGSGAFADVHRGTQPTLSRDVAIKSVRSELANHPDFIRGFEAEASIIARLEHPHIVPLYDYWREPGRAYLVMRWLTGGSLEASLDSGPWSAERTVAMVEQIGAALALAHRAGVVHRDVKTANILLDEEENAYLSDFGIAVDDEGLENPTAVLSSGSPAYAAPEQLRREGVGPTADIFGLGIATYETLTGQLPFPHARDKAELLQLQMHDPIPAASRIRPDLPSGVDRVLETATAKDPSSRFQDVGAFVEAFVSAFAESPGASLAIRDAGARVASISGAVDNPYKGLEAFGEGDAQKFFGRERLVGELLDQVDSAGSGRNFLAVVGPSGSGKSSVVNAGLIPALRAGGVEGSQDWFITTMTPGSQPFASLEEALLRIAVNPPATLLQQLSESPRGIVRGMQRILTGDHAKALLIIDQFEELFTLCDDEQVRTRFLEALAVAVGDSSNTLRLIITLRADFYDQPLRYPGFAELLKHRSVAVTPLAADELEQVIVRPAQAVGVEFEAGLVAEMMADVASQPGGLPLLQFALTQTFDARASGLMTVSGYRALGGLTGALSTRAEGLYQDLNEAAAGAARRVFGRLVSLGEDGANTRRRVQRAELGDDPDVDEVIDVFGRARLLSFDRDAATREPTVEIAHEALIREWPRLQTWLDEDRDDLRVLRGLADASQRWDSGGREDADLYRGGRLDAAAALQLAKPEVISALEYEFLTGSIVAEADRVAAERRANRRLRRLLVALGVLLIFAAGAAVFAVISQQSAVEDRDAAREAEDASREAEAVSRDAEAASRDAEAVAIEEQDRAEEALDESRAAQQAAQASELGLAHAAARGQASEDPALAALIAAELDQLDPGTRSWATLGHTLLATPGWLGNIVGHASLEVDAERLAVVEPNAVVIYDSSSLRPIDRFPSPYEVDLASYPAGAPDGSRAVIAVTGGMAIVNLATGEFGELIESPGRGITMAWTADGEHVLTGVDNSELVAYRVDDLSATRVASSPIDLRGRLAVNLVVAAHPSEPLVNVGWEGILETWDVSAADSGILEPVESYDLAGLTPTGLLVHTWDADGVIWVAGLGSAIRIDEGEVEEIPAPEEIGLTDSVRRLADGGVFVGGSQGWVVLDPGTGQVLDGPTETGTNSVLVSEAMDGGAVVVHGLLGDAAVWSRAGGNPLMETLPDFHAFGDDVYTDLFQYDDESGVGIVGKAEVWSLGGESPSRIEFAAPEPYEAATLSRTDAGPVVGLDSADGVTRVYDAVSGEELFSQEIDGEKRWVTMTPSRERIVVVSFPTVPQPTIRIYDRVTGDLLHTIDGGFDLVIDVDEAANRAVFGSSEGTQLIEWDSFELIGESIPAVKPRLSPDGALLVQANDDFDIVITDVETGEVELTIPGVSAHNQFIDRTGTTVVRTGGLLRIWALSDGTALTTELELLSQVLTGEDGPTVVTAGGRAHLFNTDPTTWADAACHAGGRVLTADEWDRYLPAGLPYEPICETSP